MKERPILFKDEMIRATLEGRKTQTRRAYKIRKHPDFGCEMAASELVREPQHFIDRMCPYGQPGDRLWVRETHAIDGSIVRYHATDNVNELRRKRPSIFMPRWASRITLEITGVRVERLKDISEEDARSEGAPPSHPSIDRISREFGHPDFSRSWFAQLWESINGHGSWNENPWVWVVEFKRVQP